MAGASEQIEMQTDDAPRGDAAHPQDADRSATGGFLTEQLSGLLLAEMDSFFSGQILPRAKSIEDDVSALQYEADVLTEKCAIEKQQTDDDLKRLTDVVLQFQAHIARFLGLPHEQ
jgi:hypothetical protein